MADAIQIERELRALCDPMAEAMPEGVRLTALINLGRDAADQLSRLRERYREALDIIRPFAAYNEATDPGDWASDGEIGEQIIGAYRRSIKLRDLRAARAFLAEAGRAALSEEKGR
jgi:hypothetical protein